MDDSKLSVMRKICKVISLILYYGIAKHLPNYSFPGGVFYNWIRIKLLKNILPIGDKNKIMRNVYVGDGDRISVGNNCRINEGVRLCNVTIGDNVMIARNHVFIGAQHKFERTDIPMVEQGFEWDKLTIIENDIWIGINVVIMPGIRVKSGCIIAAGAILTKDTESYGIYGGNPARILGKRK